MEYPTPTILSNLPISYAQLDHTFWTIGNLIEFKIPSVLYTRNTILQRTADMAILQLTAHVKLARHANRAPNKIMINLQWFRCIPPGRDGYVNTLPHVKYLQSKGPHHRSDH